MAAKRDIPLHAARKLAEIAPGLVRQTADAVAAGRPADSTLAGHFRAHRELGSRDRRFLSDLVFSYFRWKGWTRDQGLAHALVLSYQLDAMDIHPSIAILADRQDLQPLAGLSLEEKSVVIGNARVEDLVPAWFREVVHEPDAHFRKCIEAFQKRPPTWLRIAGAGGAKPLAEPFPIDSGSAGTPRPTPHPEIPGAWSVTGSPVISSPHIEIQDLASQIVGLICDPKPGESWWDVCAGSGGKSLHLADLMKNEGSILATDIRESALQELRRRAKRAGASIIQPTPVSPPKEGNDQKSPPREGWPQGRGGFNGVLVDAPCSGIGTWSRNPDARWRTTKDDVMARAETQAKILREAADGVRAGGRLVYAVCTITDAETVRVIESFLSRRKDFALDGEPRWVWPWEGPCDGMFVARMKRK